MSSLTSAMLFLAAEYQFSLTLWNIRSARSKCPPFKKSTYTRITRPQKMLNHESLWNDKSRFELWPHLQWKEVLCEWFHSDEIGGYDHSRGVVSTVMIWGSLSWKINTTDRNYQNIIKFTSRSLSSMFNKELKYYIQNYTKFCSLSSIFSTKQYKSLYFSSNEVLFS